MKAGDQEPQILLRVGINLAEAQKTSGQKLAFGHLVACWKKEKVSLFIEHVL